MERVSVGDGRKESLSDDGSHKFVCGKASQVNEQREKYMIWLFFIWFVRLFLTHTSMYPI